MGAGDFIAAGWRKLHMYMYNTAFIFHFMAALTTLPPLPILGLRKKLFLGVTHTKKTILNWE